jgi:hypothetical protein
VKFDVVVASLLESSAKVIGKRSPAKKVACLYFVKISSTSLLLKS